jgi:hypothetical protein
MDRPRDKTTGVSAAGAAVHDDVDVLGDEGAVLRDAAAVADDRRVALRRRRDVLVAVVDHPHRPAALARQERGVEGEHRRVFLLPPAAAGLGGPPGRRRRRGGEPFIALWM